MDIVRISLAGLGYDVIRGIVAKKVYVKMNNSDSLNNVWVKNLNKKIRKKVKGFIEEFHDYGISKGEIKVELNGEEILNIPIGVLGNFDLIQSEEYSYPITEEVVLTSIQRLEGLFMDVMFVTPEEFDMTKFNFIEKEIKNEKGEIISSLITKVYYDGELINFNGNTELIMSNVYFDSDNKNL